MTDETIVTIGGEAIAVPPMNFAALKRAWPAIRGLAAKSDLVEQAESVIAILAAALERSRPELTAEAIAERLTGHEFRHLVTAAPKLLTASGLVPEEGAASGEAQPGTSIGTRSPPNSSASALGPGTKSSAP